jgi:tetratricopeptide (TPR) repeat protein
LVGLRSTAALVDSEEEAREVLDSIQDLLTCSESDSWRIAAIEAAQNPLYYLGDRQEAGKYFCLIRTLEQSATDLEDQARLGASLAICAWLAGKREETPEVVSRLRALSGRCKAGGLANLSTLNLLLTSACLQSTLGMYAAALEAFLTAYSIAAKLGNEPKMGSVASNISMCHGRTGNYAGELQWAQKAISLLRGAGVGWKAHQAAYYRSLALCMMGENLKAIQAIEEVSLVKYGTRPAWSAQAVPLMTADIYLAGGERTKASKVAITAFEETGTTPLTESHVGIVSRWIARTSEHVGGEQEASHVVGRLLDDLESHDLMDQAEIICAKLWLENRRSNNWCYGRDILADRLARLPAAVEHQLRRLEAFP